MRDDVERLARAMDFDAWDALDSGRDQIGHQVKRSQTIRHAEIAIAALSQPTLTGDAEDWPSDIGVSLEEYEAFQRVSAALAAQRIETNG